MTTQTAVKPELAPETAVVLAMDSGKEGVFERGYYLCQAGHIKKLDADTLVAAIPDSAQVRVVIYPTRTGGDGMGGSLFSDIAPEDRHMIRRVLGRFAQARCSKVLLKETSVFESLSGYLQNEGERAKHAAERMASRDHAPDDDFRRGLVALDTRYLFRMRSIFAGCMTKPNRQDYTWLLTKTFGFNLIVRLAFVSKAVMKGDVPLFRAVVSTSWYQMQDAVFTVFGQTYMKFLGKMTGMVFFGRFLMGDFVFVFIQLCLLEFINRLVLGPVGENPLVYTWSGISLIFVNILQGMCSGGPITPAINKMRHSGFISHSTMMHLYQVASLTMQFGLFATFGYQRFYAFLTGGVLVLAWSSYVLFSTFFKDPEFAPVADAAPYDKLAAACYSL